MPSKVLARGRPVSMRMVSVIGVRTAHRQSALKQDESWQDQLRFERNRPRRWWRFSIDSNNGERRQRSSAVRTKNHSRNMHSATPRTPRCLAAIALFIGALSLFISGVQLFRDCSIESKAHFRIIEMYNMISLRKALYFCLLTRSARRRSSNDIRQRTQSYLMLPYEPELATQCTTRAAVNNEFSFIYGMFLCRP
uniref:Toxoplasma gondii family C protein n=1 Tax=Heterorhabditis bacteriophora TaxID=37862 RepID=A0A1I7WPW3_HETBA